MKAKLLYILYTDRTVEELQEVRPNHSFATLETDGLTNTIEVEVELQADPNSPFECVEQYAQETGEDIFVFKLTLENGIELTEEQQEEEA